MVIVTPAIRKIYKDLIKEVVEDLHKPVLAFLDPEKVDCPNCIYDHINNTSSGNFDSSFTSSVTIFGNVINPISFTRGRCPVCYGVGYLENAIQRNIKAIVKWNPKPDDLEPLPVGREGASTVRLKALRSDYDIVANAVYFVVDGVRCERIKPLAIRGLGTQEELVIAYLVEVEVGSDIKK